MSYALNNVKIQIIAPRSLYFFIFPRSSLRYFVHIFSEPLLNYPPLWYEHFKPMRRNYTKLRRFLIIQLYNLYTSPHIKPTETTTWKEWEGNTAHIVNIRKINKKIWSKNSKIGDYGKAQALTGVKMVLKEMGCKSEKWMHLAHVDT
jgi:hypothetical protein